MPANETLENFAKTGTTLAIHLSVHVLDDVVERLTPFYGADCPAAVIWRASWPDQRIVRATLATLAAATEGERGRTAIIMVGPVLGTDDFRESALYAEGYDRRFRPTGAAPRFPKGTE
jgi:precorrin-4/cobalt-precorrin-4 C11-methyltransferase